MSNSKRKSKKSDKEQGNLEKCDVCKGRGFHINYNRFWKPIKTTCLICKGSGLVKKEKEK